MLQRPQDLMISVLPAWESQAPLPDTWEATYTTSITMVWILDVRDAQYVYCTMYNNQTQYTFDK